jgi:4-azaleucine resistance transporter AzlC
VSDRSQIAGAPSARRREFLHGVRDTLPFMFGSIAFGVIFGTSAIGAGLSPLATMAMSLFVFSGSAQFIAVLLLAAHSGAWVVWFATFVLNLRHLLYAATLVDEVRHLRQTWRFPLAAFLTDETFAVMERRYRTLGGGPDAHWYYAGSCLGMYVNWQFWTFVGVTIGDRYEVLQAWAAQAGYQLPPIQDLGFDFAMVATFIGIVVPLLVNLPYWAAAITAGLVAVLANPLPYKMGLMLGALAGIVVGLLLDLRKGGKQPVTDNPILDPDNTQKKTWA